MSKKITTEISIKAKPEKVWKILTDFENHSNWNPFIKHISGDKKEGAKLKVVISFDKNGGGKMKFKPEILSFKENQEFIWCGKVLFSGIFDGEHRFILEKTKEGTNFIQEEIFEGFLVNILPKSLYERTEKGFKKMNEALKKEAEKK